MLSLGAVLVARRVTVTINKVNENSIFQPHEHTEKRVYCALALLEFHPHPRPKDMFWDDEFDYLTFMGCPTYLVGHIEDVKNILEGMDS